MDLALLLTWLAFLVVGFVAPFVWGLGYVWVDVLTPHRISYSLLNTLPIAFITGAGSLLFYLMLDRKNPPKLTLEHGLIAVLGVWITLTQTWALYPIPAWTKWDPSFKVLVFTFFIPFLFRSRVQIEAYVLVLIMSAAGHLLPWGLKTLVSGGGYEQSLGLLGVNASIMSESSSVAAIAIMFVPLIVWARAHSIIVPRIKLASLGFAGLVVVFLVASIGTFARTGLVGLAILGSVMFVRSRQKFLFVIAAVIVGAIMISVTSDRWTERMSTISNVQGETSAYARLFIWKWTLGFVADHPLGGGFNAYFGNVIVLPPDADGTPNILYGRAFHNIFFAVLGEHGFPGLVIYVSILLLALYRMQRLAKTIRGRPEFNWIYDLARASQLSLIIMMACGNFVDLSFLFVIWNIIALMLCLNNHVLQSLKTTTVRSSTPAVAGPQLAHARLAMSER
ncbi:MAG: putative O-glycosylation ligase, exosortase A system-associated [Janthinobacterium lividum]